MLDEVRLFFKQVSKEAEIQEAVRHAERSPDKMQNDLLIKN